MSIFWVYHTKISNWAHWSGLKCLFFEYITQKLATELIEVDWNVYFLTTSEVYHLHPNAHSRRLSIFQKVSPHPVCTQPSSRLHPVAPAGRRQSSFIEKSHFVLPFSSFLSSFSLRRIAEYHAAERKGCPPGTKSALHYALSSKLRTLPQPSASPPRSALANFFVSFFTKIKNSQQNFIIFPRIFRECTTDFADQWDQKRTDQRCGVWRPRWRGIATSSKKSTFFLFF